MRDAPVAQRPPSLGGRCATMAGAGIAAEPTAQLALSQRGRYRAWTPLFPASVDGYVLLVLTWYHLPFVPHLSFPRLVETTSPGR